MYASSECRAWEVTQGLDPRLMRNLMALKATIDLRQLIPATGDRKNYPNYDQDICPFHNDTRPSFLIYPDGFRCLGCGARGDVFDYLARSENLGLREAIQRVETLPKSERLFLPSVRKKIIRSVPQGLAWELHLNAVSDPSVLEYYQQHLGFDMHTVVRYQLGYGCLPNKDVPRFMIPYFRNGKLVNIKARRDDRCTHCKRVATVDTDGDLYCETCDRTSTQMDPDLKYIQLFGVGGPYLYNADWLYGWHDGTLNNYPPGQRSVFLTEGEYKALAICQAGAYGISWGNATTFPEEWASVLIEADRIFLVADSDNAGNDSLRRILRLVPYATVIRLPNPPKGDAQEFLRDYGADAFWAEVSRQARLPYNLRDIRQLAHNLDNFVERLCLASRETNFSSPLAA